MVSTLPVLAVIARVHLSSRVPEKYPDLFDSKAALHNRKAAFFVITGREDNDVQAQADG